MRCRACPANRTEAGRSTDFNILVHLDRIGDSRLTQGYARHLRPGKQGTAYVENVTDKNILGANVSMPSSVAGGVALLEELCADLSRNSRKELRRRRTPPGCRRLLARCPSTP